MRNELQCVDSGGLTEAEKTEINSQIDQIIERHKNNRYEINRLVFESTAALTAGNNLACEKASQGLLKRFWNGLTGKNNKIQADIDRNLAQAQYASQQTLQKLAEQNLMSFELITAVNNKLNASMVAVEQEINHIYGTMLTFFKQSRSDIVQLETRVERLEKNVALLNWQNSIEYQMYNGIEYRDLDDVTKMVCLIRDFYDLTGGNWKTSDLLLLKAAMADMGLEARAKMKYEEFIRKVSSRQELYEHLLGTELMDIKASPAYETLAAGIKKMWVLQGQEKYLVDTTRKLLAKNEIQMDEQELAYQIAAEYIGQEQSMDFRIEVNNYEFILEVLYNLEQLKYKKTLHQKLLLAEQYYLNCSIEEAKPLLEELSDLGVMRAKYMLACIFDDGNQVPCDVDKAKQLLFENQQDGDINSCVYYARRFGDFEGLEAYKEQLILKADRGDVFAQNELALCYLDENLISDGAADYDKALQYFQMAAAQGYFRAYYSIGVRYYTGEGVEKNYQIAENYFKRVEAMGYGDAMLYLGKIYKRGDGHIEKNQSVEIGWFKKALEAGRHDDESINQIARDYSHKGNASEALKYWTLGEEYGYPCCIANLGWAYRWGKGVDVDYIKAGEYFKKAIEKGSDNGYEERNLAELYKNGNGVTCDWAIAKEWYEKAAAKGDEDAIAALKTM